MVLFRWADSITSYQREGNGTVRRCIYGGSYRDYWICALQRAYIYRGLAWLFALPHSAITFAPFLPASPYALRREELREERQ